MGSGLLGSGCYLIAREVLVVRHELLLRDESMLLDWSVKGFIHKVTFVICFIRVNIVHNIMLFSTLVYGYNVIEMSMILNWFFF